MQPQDSYSTYQSQRLTELAVKLRKQAKWQSRIDAVIGELDQHDRGLNESLRLDMENSPGLHRAIRYVFPLIEIAEAIGDVRSEQQTVRLLTATVLWGELWRPLDDLLDREANLTSALVEYTQALLRADHYTRERLGDPWQAGQYIGAYLNENIMVEDSKEARADFHQIYLRARVFDTATIVSEVSKSTIDCYHQYINLLGFSHDLIDFFDDRQKNIVTPVQKIWESVQQDGCFSHRRIEEFQNRCANLLNVETKQFLDRFNSRPEIALENIKEASEWVQSNG